MKRLIPFWLALGLLLLSACSRGTPAPLAPDAPADAVPDLVGEYAVNGFDPLGTEYGGRLTITAADTPGTYHMQWIITGSIQVGVATLQGNQLLVEWRTTDDFSGGSQGTATYTVTVNGELYGTRTVEGHSETGTETAYPNK